MPAPSLSPYNTNGPVRTGRTQGAGDYFSGSLRAKAVNGELCAGKLTYSGLRSFDAVPVITWSEYPTGIVDIPLSGGNPTSSAPSAIWDSYNVPWYCWTNFYPYPTKDRPTHQVELRYMVTLYSSATRLIVWFSSGSGSDYYLSPTPPPGPQFEIWTPAKTFDLSVSVEAQFDVSCVERVSIEQQTSSGDWVWPTDCYPDGIGTTRATFDLRATNASSSITINGSTFSGELPTGYMADYPFTSVRNISGKAGLYTNNVDAFGWGTLIRTATPYTMTGGGVYSSLTEVARMTVGITDMDLRLRPGQLYQGDDTNCQGKAQDHEIWYLAKNAPSSASGAGVYTHAAWSNIGLHYKHEVDFAAMDGVTTGLPTPEFIDVASSTAWSGTSSDRIDYDGTWDLVMKNLSGSTMSTRNTNTDQNGTGATWHRSNDAPTEISVRFTNPQAFNDTDSGSTDDFNVKLLYPCKKEVLTWSLANEAMYDELNTIGTLGVGGWTAVNCTLAVVGGCLQVTGATDGAYIYRSDYMTSSDIRQPKHWPGHRFTQLLINGVDYPLNITVKRTGGADSSSKIYNNAVTFAAGGDTLGIFDMCYPEGFGSSDTAETYIDQAQPLATEWISGSRQGAELSNLSPTWGPGAFDKVQIGGFNPDTTYTLRYMKTVYIEPYVAGLPDTHYGQVTYVQQEMDGWRSIGNTALNSYPEDDIQLSACKGIAGIINGRIGFEVISTKKSVTGTYGVETYENISIKGAFSTAGAKFPVDDYSVYSFSPNADYSDCWDATDEEYTNEDTALFSGDVCPVSFCLTAGVSRGEHDNIHDHSIYAAPHYEIGQFHPWYGDGAGGARTGYLTIRSIKRVGCRAHGIVWDAGKTPYDAADPDSLNASLYNSDSRGYFRSGAKYYPASVNLGTSISIGSKNRHWYRACYSPSTGWLRYNPATGELLFKFYTPSEGALSACNQA